MSKRLWLNLMLLIVGGILIYFIGYQPKQGQQGQRFPVILFTTAPYQAVDIHIKRVDKPDIVFKRIEDQWRLIKPGIAPVNAEKIKHLLTILQEPIVASYELEGKDLSQFGLSSGKIKLIINTEEAIFGSTNPVTLNRYILKNNKIHMIHEIVFGVLGTSVTPFLTHRLVPEGVEIVAVNAPELLNKVSIDFWHLIEARNIADYEDTETVIGKMNLRFQSKDGIDKGSIQEINLDVLAIKPSLILGRADLRVKYTFDEGILIDK